MSLLFKYSVIESTSNLVAQNIIPHLSSFWSSSSMTGIKYANALFFFPVFNKYFLCQNEMSKC